MHQRSTLSLVLAFLCLGLLTAVPAAAQRYEVIDLGDVAGTHSQARGISESGVTAGYAIIFPGGQRAVLWGDQDVEELGVPDGFSVSVGVAVNDSRQVAATGEGSPQTYGAYFWENGTWTSLGTLPGHAESIAEDIDAAGRVVGRSFNLGAGDGRAFLWEGGGLIDLGTLGGASVAAYGINGLRQVAGVSGVVLPGGAPGRRAFLWENGAMQDLGVLPGEDHSQAFDINDLGEVVGSSWHGTPNFLLVHRATLWRDGGEEIVDLGQTPDPLQRCGFLFPVNIALATNSCGQVVGHAHCVSSGAALAAFLWQNGVNSNLNELIPPGSGWNLISARDVNDAGEIVGYGIGPNSDNLHAFLLRPLAATPCGGCDQNVDCDDGRFCNGAETCLEGICEPGFDPCQGLPCDEAEDLCLASPCDGDGVCESGEDCLLCPDECVGGTPAARCGDGLCQAGAGESCDNCPEDCSGILKGRQDARFCCGDNDGYLPTGCGDLRCNRDGFSCTGGSQGVPYCCGDGTCNGDENQGNCPLDCGDPNAPCDVVGSPCEVDDDCCSLKCSGRVCRRSNLVRDEGE